MTITEEIVEVAKKLIEFESIESRPDQLKAIIDFVENYLKKNTKLNLKRFEVKGKHSLVGIFPPRLPESALRAHSDSGSQAIPEVFFHDHLDVVPGKSEQFKPYIEDGKLYGRGASDTKGNGATLLVLAKELSRQIPDPALRAHSGSGILKESPGVFPNVGFMFTTDEEIGGHNGAKYLLEKGYRCQFFITAEPTGFNIVPAHKGILWVKIKVKGRSAHSSKLWEGENAILKALSGFEKLSKLFPQPKKSSWQTTVNLSGIESGDAFNKVPGECLLKLDIRRTEKDSPESIIGKIKRCFPGAEIEIIEDEALMNTSFKNPYIKKLSALIEKVSLRVPSIHRGNGACDGRFYANAGIPAIQFGTASKGIHTDNEFLIIPALENFYKILLEFSNSVA